MLDRIEEFPYKRQTLFDVCKSIIIIIGPLGLSFLYQHIYGVPGETKSLKYQLIFFMAVICWIAAVLLITFLDRRLRTSFVQRKLDAYKSKIGQLKQHIERVYRANQHLDELTSAVSRRISDVNRNKNSDYLISLKNIFDLEKCINEVIAQIYYYYEKEPNKETGQQYRVTCMVPINEDELQIQYYQTPKSEEPISFTRKVRFKKDYETCAGYAWLTMQAYKIENIDEYLKERKGSDRHFKIIHPEQERNIKSIFSIPIYEEPQPGGPFYGILNIDTNVPGRFVHYSGVDYQLEMMKPFLKRIIYYHKIVNLLQ